MQWSLTGTTHINGDGHRGGELVLFLESRFPSKGFFASDRAGTVGNVDGEIMETLWLSLNIISPSTWGMAAPHWQEMLDFQMNDSNFLKMVHMCE